MSLILTSLAEAKAALEIDYTEDDTLVTNLLLAAEGVFRQRIGGRLIQSAEQIEHHDGGKLKLFLRQWPASTSGLTVVDTKSTNDTGDDETMDATLYRLYPERGVLVRTTAGGVIRPWARGVRRWKITYTGGLDQMADWSNMRLPVLQQTIHQLAGRWYDEVGAALGAGKGIDVPKVIARGIPQEIQEVWAAYQAAA